MMPVSFKRSNAYTNEKEEKTTRKRRRIRVQSLTKNVFLRLCESPEGKDIINIIENNLDMPSHISLSRVNRDFAARFLVKWSRFNLSLPVKNIAANKKDLFPLQCLTFSYTKLYLWGVVEQNCFSNKLDYAFWKKVILQAFANPYVTSDMIRAILQTCPQTDRKIPYQAFKQIVCHNNENFIEWVIKDCPTQKAVNKFFCMPEYRVIAEFASRRVSCSFLKWYTNNKRGFSVHWLKNPFYATSVFNGLAATGNYKDFLWAISVIPQSVSLTTFTGPEIFIPMLKSNVEFAFKSMPYFCFISFNEEILIFWMTLLASSIKSGHLMLQNIKDDGSKVDNLAQFKNITTSDAYKKLKVMDIEAVYAYDEHHEWWRSPRIVAPYIDAIKYLRRFGKPNEWTLPPLISSIKSMRNQDFHCMYELLHPMFDTTMS